MKKTLRSKLLNAGFALLFFACPAAPCSSQSPKAVAENQTLTVRLNGFRNSGNTVRIHLYDDTKKKSFPSAEKNCLREKILTVDGVSMEFTFDGLPRGTYAISAHHDENNDGTMNTGTFGFPVEGYGFSGNPKLTLGPPKFDQAAIEFSDSAQIEIAIRYF